jgi:hypothetical protein
MSHTYEILTCTYNGTGSDRNPPLTLTFEVDGISFYAGDVMPLNAVLQANYVSGVNGVRDILGAFMLGQFLYQTAFPVTNYPRPSGTYSTASSNLPAPASPDPTLTAVSVAQALAAGTWTA